MNLHRPFKSSDTFILRDFIAAPTDSATIFLGMGVSAAVADVNKCFMHKSGVINRVGLNVVSSAAGSNESSSIWVRLNNTTDFLITSVIDNSTLGTSYNIDTLGLNVVDGDYLEIKWTTPAWVTNPGNVWFGLTLQLE